MSHTKPSIIDHALSPIRIVITDCPPSQQLLTDNYIPVFEELHVSHLIRLCQPTYETDALEQAGVKVVDEMAFTDGSAPSIDIVTAYRTLIDSLVAKNGGGREKPTIAVHCVSGVGRAPIFALIPLVDAGLDRVDAVEFIRAKRRGAFNKIQLNWILDEKDGLKAKKRKQKFSFGSKASNLNNEDSSSQRNSTTSVSASIGTSSTTSKRSGGLFGMFKKK
ncbi:Protein tyrosine phosphatase type IVA 1 [Podochytrium sp. JEL0797]|nr:Protein tyrosine phosphatase type IVA 1 [Podochytrium sp. JEL0797]